MKKVTVILFSLIVNFLFATGSVQWDGQKLLALTPNGEMELRYIDEIYDVNNNWNSYDKVDKKIRP